MREETIEVLIGSRTATSIPCRECASDAVEAAVFRSSRYVADRFLPDKAIDLVDEAGAAPSCARLQRRVRRMDPQHPRRRRAAEERGIGEELREGESYREQEAQARENLQFVREHLDVSRLRPGRVGKGDIDEVVSKWTGVPLTSVNQDEGDKLLRMEEELHSRVISQEKAISALSRAIRRSRAGLKNPNRPVGSFVFLGPTGVGKTELARALANFLFGSDHALIRFDMSEYMEKHSVTKLIGSPPGYVGHEEGGQLTEKVKRNPYSVVLLDEIEKAHPDMFNILLQVFEDGHLTDGLGNRVNFKNTIIIMTSNIGARFIQKKASLGFQTGDAGVISRSVNDMVLARSARPSTPSSSTVSTKSSSSTRCRDETSGHHPAAGEAAERQPGRSQDPTSSWRPRSWTGSSSRPARTARTAHGRCAGRSSATSRTRCRRSSFAGISRAATSRSTSTVVSWPTARRARSWTADGWPDARPVAPDGLRQGRMGALTSKIQ